MARQVIARRDTPRAQHWSSRRQLIDRREFRSWFSILRVMSDGGATDVVAVEWSTRAPSHQSTQWWRSITVPGGPSHDALVVIARAWAEREAGATDRG